VRELQGAGRRDQAVRTGKAAAGLVHHDEADHGVRPPRNGGTGGGGVRRLSPVAQAGSATTRAGWTGIGSFTGGWDRDIRLEHESPGGSSSRRRVFRTRRKSET